jgi:hypothetical protein
MTSFTTRLATNTLPATRPTLPQRSVNPKRSVHIRNHIIFILGINWHEMCWEIYFFEREIVTWEGCHAGPIREGPLRIVAVGGVSGGDGLLLYSLRCGGSV